MLGQDMHRDKLQLPAVVAHLAPVVLHGQIVILVGLGHPHTLLLAKKNWLSQEMVVVLDRRGLLSLYNLFRQSVDTVDRIKYYNCNYNTIYSIKGI